MKIVRSFQLKQPQKAVKSFGKKISLNHNFQPSLQARSFLAKSSFSNSKPSTFDVCSHPDCQHLHMEYTSHGCSSGATYTENCVVPYPQAIGFSEDPCKFLCTDYYITCRDNATGEYFECLYPQTVACSPLGNPCDAGI